MTPLQEVDVYVPARVGRLATALLSPSTGELWVPTV